MRVDVLYFGVLKDLFGGTREFVELPDGGSVGDLLAVLRERRTDELPVWSSLAVAVNREYMGRGTELHAGDEVALLPPVSGGSGAR